jgi:hypothetical protein
VVAVYLKQRWKCWLILTTQNRVTWIALPVAVYYVNQNVEVNQSPDKVLLPFLNQFMRRTSGAQYLFSALTKAMKDFLQRLNDNTRTLGTQSLEARVLAHVLKVLDYKLERGC